MSLWRACDGKPGVMALRDLSPHILDAFAVIDAGRANKIETDAKQARDHAAAARDEPRAPPKKGRRR